jgi:pyruvate/2-oxoglutarate dehydrogenase complex dihydrolipoamide dehydrogenase (E3) component
MSRFPGLAGRADSPDWSQLVDAKDDLVATLRQQKYADLLPSYEGVDYIQGRARILSDGSMEVDGCGILADKLLVATGAAPAVPDIDGILAVPYLTSTGAKIAALNALNGDSLVYDNATMPWVTFTDPQVAGVGLTEAAARAVGRSAPQIIGRRGSSGCQNGLAASRVTSDRDKPQSERAWSLSPERCRRSFTRCSHRRTCLNIDRRNISAPNPSSDDRSVWKIVVSRAFGE